jgi:phosphoglycerate dehydrogenase-like enzyme
MSSTRSTKDEHDSEHGRRLNVVQAMSVASAGRLLDARSVAELHAVADVDLELVLSDWAQAAALAGADVLLTCWGCPPITATELALMPRLRAIVHGAGTVKGHVTQDCWDAGLLVSTAADANAVPVAEYTVAMITLACKRVFAVIDDARTPAGRAGARHDFGRQQPRTGMYRTVIGLIGASRVGRATAALLRPLDVEVLLADPTISADAAAELGATLVELDELMQRSEIVSMHAPNIPATRHMIDARRLALMRDGATLINTSRGALLDHDALIAETAGGRLWAILDVTDPEPLPADSPLWDMPNVVLTPHIAGSVGGEIYRMGADAVAEIARLASGLPLAHGITEAQVATQA